MIVIADATVLISLSTIGRLGIIRDRFPDGIQIPSAVWKEVVEQGKERPGAKEVASADWITVRQIEDDRFVQYLTMGIDEGEAEAIGLARETNAQVILIDERDARDAAKGLGIQVLGTIGLLIWAKRAGKLKNLKQELDNLQELAKFRVSPALYQLCLEEVGE